MGTMLFKKYFILNLSRVMSKTLLAFLALAVLLLLSGCPAPPEPNGGTGTPPNGNPPNGTPPDQPPYVPPDRESKIPDDLAKITPETDMYPPVLHSDEFEEPVPMPYPINTRGAEDSPFIMPDGKTFFVWSTPDPRIPAEGQVFDEVTGLYVSKKVNGEWTKPERILLQEPGKGALDGCVFVQGNKMYFCSAREGYTGMNWFKAELINGKWQNWAYAGDELKQEEFETGELHISADGTELYFHSSRAGGKGKYDIWVSKKVNGAWQKPENIEIVNSEEHDGWPFVSQDGSELWITRSLGAPALLRSKKVNGEWTEPELIVSMFAGEATLDNEGNLYFTHHFYKDNNMLEADYYVAYKK